MDAIWSGVFAISGAVVGGVFSLLAARSGTSWNDVRKDVRKLSAQVISYWHLEKEYLDEFTADDSEGRARKTIQEEMRTAVEGRGQCRPVMTELEARKILEKWD